MTPSSVHDIRNLSLLGNTGSGKTTLIHALLEAAGVKDAGAAGEGHSLAASLSHLEWNEHWINLLDTPGLPDLVGRALATLAAVETAAIVINAVAGVESGTRRLMAAAEGKCRLLIVNKIDADGADAAAVIAALNASFGRECLPLNLPSADGKAVVDCFFAPDTNAATAFSNVSAAHEAIIDQVIELDEDLMARYLEQGEALEPEQLHAPFEAALRNGHLIPVCFVSAKTGAGVKELLDVLGKLAPDPTEGNPPQFLKGEGATAELIDINPDPQAHALAHVFQISNDPYRGKIALFRVHQGTVAAGSSLFVGDGRKPFKVVHLLRLQGQATTETRLAVPGDLCAVSRIDELHHDAVLHDSHDEDFFHLRPIAYPQPVFGLALITRKASDEQRLGDALARLTDEDPCLEVGYDPRSRRTVVRGLGAQHLKIVLDELSSRWNVELDTEPPAIPYRETITATAEARYRHKKQSGGAGQFGEVALRVEALPRGAGLELADEVKGGAIPVQFMPAVEKGVRQAIAEGALAGYPIHDLRVIVTDGKHHPVDSNEVSFVTAGRHALIDAVLAARPQILEPIVEVQVKIADEYFGNVSAELAIRRGHVTATDSPANGWTVITAAVPMADMDGFEARLKALCAGESEFVVTIGGYEPVTGDVQARLVSEHAQR
ncbi:elongation factor G [Betaproteobacteria bacterium]|nr:elongation factor G [Betaproteobacteria bacterium]GHT97228.1 elongation factor G [Betaproteobacteria bacterium]GHU23038.1 elongation factor G [Betaproteobacteria bacterium]